MRLRTPSEVAVELHCSERHLRKLARDLGACSVVGKVMLLSDADVQTIFDASRPAPRLGRAPPVTFRGVPEGDFETLRMRVEKAVSNRRTA